mgnify:CR=1 FL=1
MTFLYLLSLKRQDANVKAYTIKFCETNNDFFYPSSIAAREHKAEVIAHYLYIELTDARVKIGTRFLFPVLVSLAFPSGWSKVRLKEYLRRPVGQKRAHLREMAVLDSAAFMHDNNGKGVAARQGMTGPAVLEESDLVSSFRDGYWCRSAVGKQGVVAAMMAVDKALDCTTGWFVDATDEEPLEHLPTSVGHYAIVRCWVRFSRGLISWPD